MPESWATLLSYRLHDLLMFSADTYFRLFEIVNRRTWPAPLVGELFALGVLTAAARRPAAHTSTRRMTAVMTAVMTAGMTLAPALASSAVAALYFRGGFSDIHWLGGWWSGTFLLHAVAWLACFTHLAFFASPHTAPWAAGLQRTVGLTLLLAAAAWPALAPISQRPLWQSEVLGLAPDATVLLSLGVMLSLRLPRLWCVTLLIVPLAWCAFTGATLWAMQQPQALVLPLAGAAALACVLLDGRRAR